MIFEIEKMTSIQEKCIGEEAKEVSRIIETLSTDFGAVLEDSRHYILTGEKKETDLSKSIAAMQDMKRIGEKYGVEFPSIETNEQAAIYILKFGREIVIN